ncbi:hypothetical protein FHETE_5665 [Fusarium heterosporum]|uniref:Uncharacterized protein n=1 Tax=Fusarium heterosporum TaxID=42747 RepID=A0A8H5WLS8_FUSHE|nr:hypothetical protein FHETE_5665 [Fusarium heterosporum]
MDDLAQDINGFISEHNARRGMQVTRDAFPAMHPTYYAPSLMFSDQSANGPPTQSIDMSTASSSTLMSSCFDSHRPVAPRTASVLTEPPVYPPLVCEFIGLGGCNEVFDSFNDEAGWIAHISDVHLRNIFPAVCICWFCDRTFKAQSYSQADAEACYRKRMHHIAKHIRNDVPRGQMRPDFFFLNHVHDYGLIDEEMFQRARVYHEAPQIPNLYPAGWRPEYQDQRPTQLETSRSRHRDSQRYHY